MSTVAISRAAEQTDMAEQHAEQRKHARRQVLITCRAEGAFSHAAMRLTDLSEGGCFVATGAEFPRGLRLTLVATVAGSDVTLAGRVAHTQPGRGFGFEIDFDESPRGTRQQLEALLIRRNVSA
jgi:Tfp pilus assembly protein PilZ